MARRIEVRVRGRILLLFLLIAGLPLYVRYGAEPEAFTRTFERIVGNWPRLGLPDGCLDITVHAHVFGRPFGAIEFMNCLEAARRYGAWACLTDHQTLAGLSKAR